eukprot:m.12389 g.12389  ORF g.12389 m.12389 type:complete len:218 (+) comp2727_c0_seq1:74-727(+)
MVQKTIPLWVIFRQFILLSWRMICVFGAVTCIVGYLYGTWATVLMFIIGFFAVCYLCQRQFIYFPNVPVTSRTFVQTPGAMGMSFENVFLQTTDRVKLNAMFIHRQDADVAKRPTVLYLHGNAGNIGHQLVCAKGFHALCGFNVFLLEYRGYGKSEGSPSEEGFRKDAQVRKFSMLNHESAVPAIFLICRPPLSICYPGVMSAVIRLFSSAARLAVR